MRILLIASAYNGLTQRVHIELTQREYDVSITLAVSADEMINAVKDFTPHLIICPFLKEKVPDDIWKNNTCIIIHPGIKGDRGPSSLDWAITQNAKEWGVTALQADEEMDAGDIWATGNFPLRQAPKASLYRREVTQTAIRIIFEMIEKFEGSKFIPEPLDYNNLDTQGTLQPLIQQNQRKIDWAIDSSSEILIKINAADSFPGVRDEVLGETYFLFGAHLESDLRGPKPGDIIATRQGAICRATVDGAIWISHLKRTQDSKVPFQQRWKIKDKPSFKLPATKVLGKKLTNTDEIPIDILAKNPEQTFKEIWYEEEGLVGYLHFNFHNGAMSSNQCHSLLEAYRIICKRPTKVICLMGGSDFWSNGIHLNMIEAAKDPASESWKNINAIDDVVYEIITTMSHMVIAAMYGNAGAGGAIMPLAADYVIARQGCVLNPHYKTMGLFGSEYWTYLLPKRVGQAKALKMMETPLPVGMDEAKRIGMIDHIFSDNYQQYRESVRLYANKISHSDNYSILINEKKSIRIRDESEKKLSAYRSEELRAMRLNFSGKFFGGAQEYHEARYNFVYKRRPKKTANYLAKHTQIDKDSLKLLRQPLTY